MISSWSAARFSTVSTELVVVFIDRYAYLEYPTAEDATKAAEEHKEKLLNEEKLFVIKAITVRKEKFGQCVFFMFL